MIFVVFIFLHLYNNSPLHHTVTHPIFETVFGGHDELSCTAQRRLERNQQLKR